MREEKYMDYDIEMNKKDYQREKEARAKRLEAFAEIVQSDRRTYRGETQAGADTAGLSGYDGNSCTESGAAGEQKKGSNTGRAAKIRFGVRNAH